MLFIPVSEKKNHNSVRKILLNIGIIYGIWMFFSIFIYYSGQLLPTDREPAFLTSPLSILFFLTLASLLTAFFTIFAQPLLKDRHRLRKILLLLTFSLGLAFYAFVRVSGITHGLIYMASTANLLVFANLLGTWIAAPLKRAAELIPLCLVMALADIFSVAGGPTKEIAKSLENYYRSGMKGPAPFGDFILIKIPVPGVEKMVPLFGLADWVIIAFLTACAAKFSINDNMTGKSLEHMIKKQRLSLYLPMSVAGLIAGIFLARYSGVFLPALPIIIIFFLGYIMLKYPEVRKITAEDRKIMAGTLLIMGGLLALRFIFF